MTQKHTNKTLLANGVKYMATAILFMFLGPFVLHLGFKFHNYLTIGFGGLFCIVAILLVMKGLHTIIAALFD